MSVVKVTQEDIDAADTWKREWQNCRGEHTALAQAFAEHRQAAIAELCEGLRRIEERVFPHPNSSHVYVDSIRAECRALLSKHSPDAPGQHAGTRAIEPSDGDEA